MKNDLKKIYFKVQNLKFNHCLDPNGKCSSKPIKAHSIPNSLVLDQINKNGHVIMFCKSHGERGQILINYNFVGKNIATTFTGLCSKHDTEIFAPSDKPGLDLSDENHLFLLAYRSVLKETHVCIQSAIRLQAGYSERIEAKLSPKGSPDSAGLMATEYIIKAIYCLLYKKKYDEAFFRQKPEKIDSLQYFL